MIALEGWKLECEPRKNRADSMGDWKGALHFDCSIVSPNGEEWRGFYSVGSGIPIQWAKDTDNWGKVKGRRFNPRDLARLGNGRVD